MADGELQSIRIDYDDRGVATIVMNRPEVRNAFDDQLVDELHDAAVGLGADRGVRVVVLTGAGDVFSAGADLHHMRAIKDWTVAENAAEAARTDAMFRALWDLPKPLIGRVNGHALGGGSGLVAVCDIAIAADEATFGFTETTLGLAPAVISPYVLRKVGLSFARSVFVTGERFSADRAFAAGLVHELVERGGLDNAIDGAVKRCLRAGPQAVVAAKQLPDLAMGPLDEVATKTPDIIAALRVGQEGQEGMDAFFERRKPSWAPDR